MDLESMVYGDYKWKYNPAKLEVSQERNVKEHIIPFFGNKFQDYGRKKRVVKGSGEFFGEDALEQYNQLYKVFELGGVSYLKIPKLNPFLAAFISLNLIEDANPGIVRYEFEFWENVVEEPNDVTLNNDGYHIVKQNETLWSIASKYSVSVNAILSVNPQIKRPDELKVGQKVILP